jgi:hypothetical protein
MPPATLAILRTGLIGGITLGLAIAAQRYAKDYAMQSLGLIIVIVGFSLIGLFAAREGEVKRGREGLRVGLLSGLVAGFFVALAYIAINIIMALDPNQVEFVRTQYPQQLEALRELSPDLAAQSMAQWNAMNANQQAAFTQMAFGFAACCGVVYPLMGSALGAMGGAIAPGMFGMRDEA